jgi:hypothetical protein
VKDFFVTKKFRTVSTGFNNYLMNVEGCSDLELAFSGRLKTFAVGIIHLAMRISVMLTLIVMLES